MEWDQRAFAWLYRSFRKLSGRTKGDAGATVSPVEELAARFETLCQLLSGREWEVTPGAGMGGVAPGRLVLPGGLTWLPDPDDQAAFYLYRVVLGVTAIDLGLSDQTELPNARAAVLERYPGAASLALRVDSLVESHFPYDELGTPWGVLFPPDASMPAELDQPSDPQTTLPSGTERKMPRRPQDVEYVDIESQKDRDNPLVHSFEKVHTATEYESGRKQLDGSDQLAQHEEALEELDLKKVTRTSESAQSVYSADLQLGFHAADLAGEPASPKAQLYPEWNFKRRSYREGWCTVNERTCSLNSSTAQVESASRRLRGEVLRLRAALKRLELERRWRNRQLDGTEIDIDALVDRQADLLARLHPDSRIYVRRKLHDSDIAMLILIDTSLSSDSWVSNRRIFDVVRDAAQVLVESFEPSSAKVCVGAFYSNTRRDCRFVLAKGFDDLPQTGLRRLHALSPAGYTRIGPAIRHSLQLMEESGARRRLIVLLTDAKPTDYDHYEGRYGIEDVRQALREAAEKGTHCLTLAVRERPEPYLTQMFGPHGWNLLSDVHSLPDRFVATAHDFLRRR